MNIRSGEVQVYIWKLQWGTFCFWLLEHHCLYYKVISKNNVTNTRMLRHYSDFDVYVAFWYGTHHNSMQSLLTCPTVAPRLVSWHRRNKFQITLVDLQLDAQNSYLFTYNTFIKILYMFWALPCSSAGDCLVHRLRKFFLNRWTGQSPADKWWYQTLHIYNYDVYLLKMSRVMLKTCRGF